MSQQQCCPVTRCRTNWIEINNHFFPWPFREIQCYFHTTCMVMNAIRHGSAKSTMHIIYRHQLQCMLHDKMTIESTNRTDSYMYVYTVYLNCQFQREIICVRTLSLSLTVCLTWPEPFDRRISTEFLGEVELSRVDNSSGLIADWYRGYVPLSQRFSLWNADRTNFIFYHRQKHLSVLMQWKFISILFIHILWHIFFLSSRVLFYAPESHSMSSPMSLKDIHFYSFHFFFLYYYSFSTSMAIIKYQIS